jgi:hypothetical protein
MWPGDGMTIGAEERKSDGKDPSSGRYFNGLIDEVAIYNRALSTDEIKAVFAADSASITNKPKSPAVVRVAQPASSAHPVQPAATESVSQAPTLSISTKSGNLVITWPASATGFLLEGCDSFFPANWTTVDTTPVTNTSEVAVTLPLSSSQKYYRLHHP